MVKANVVNVLANGSVSEAKFSSNQLKTIESTLATIASAEFTFDKANGPKWKPLVDLCVKRGVIVDSLKKALAKSTKAAYIAAWCVGLGKKELTAQEERDASQRASKAASIAFVRYGPKKVADPAPATPEASDDSKADAKDVKLEQTLSVGNSLPNVISVTADMENALKIATQAREALVAFQVAFATTHPATAMTEQIAGVALKVGEVQDLIGKVLKLITA